MDRNELERIIREKLQEIMGAEKDDTFMVEASGRHVHLTKEHVEALFGEGYELTPVKDLSQPGQFAAKERVRVIGPKGEFSNVAIFFRYYRIQLTFQNIVLPETSFALLLQLNRHRTAADKRNRNFIFFILHP